MEYSVSEVSKTKREIALTISAEEWKEAIKKAYQKTKHQYSLEGFRKGKVPMNILISRYGEEMFYEDALDIALSESYAEVLEKEKLEVVSQPDVDVKEVNKDGVTATLVVEVKPEIVLGQYKDLEIEQPKVVVDDAEIEKEMEQERQKRSRLVEKEGEGVVIANGDVITLDYSGSVNGEKFEGGTAEDQTLEIGSNSFIPGFEKQLEGLKINESKEINVTFPTEYAPELAGKDAVFAVTIKGIKTKELPEIDDEFVKDISEELNTVAEWKADIKTKLTATREQEAQYKLENSFMEAIAATSEIEVPESMIEEELQSRIKELEQNMQQYGLKFEDYLKYSGTTIEKIKEEKREDTIKNLKYRFIMEEIMKLEKITITPEEVSAKMADLPEDRKTSQEMSYLANQMIVDKLFTFLKESNKLV
ncbi:MAG: trigger factor [Clostridia bacterium]